MKFLNDANKDIHFEFEAGVSEQNATEVEVYIGGWFLCSVDIADISPEAKEYLFEAETKED
jgi:hypothetical protein